MKTKALETPSRREVSNEEQTALTDIAFDAQ